MNHRWPSSRSNEDALSNTVSIAPFDGIVTNLPVREGETVVVGIQNAEGSTLMTIADMCVVTAEVKVDETDIVNVKIGQPAEVTVDAIPGKIFKGHVTLVGDQALLRSTGIATSQSTSGTEEAKDFKVVVTLDSQLTNCAPASRPPPRSPPRRKTTCSRCPSRLSPCTLRRRRPTTETLKLHPPRQRQKCSRCRASSLWIRIHGKQRAKFVPVTTGITGATDIEVLTGFRKATRSSSGHTKPCAL